MIPGKKRRWECICTCGNRVVRSGWDLKSGDIASCGCLRSETAKKQMTKHGLHGTPIWRVWNSMIHRCQDQSRKDWRNYGGRGITVCDRWQDFNLFFADMGHVPHGRSIDRIDNDGPYSPQNCRWATPAEQTRNTRQNNTITIDGVSRVLADWVTISGRTPATIRRRLKKGWTARDAVFIVPTKGPKPRRKRHE